MTAERLEHIFTTYGVSLFALVPFAIMLVVTGRARATAKDVRERELRDEAAFFEVYEADLVARRYAIVTGLLGAVAVAAVALTLLAPNVQVAGEGGKSNPVVNGRTPLRTHNSPKSQ